ncbi:response regulator transcription factor [Microbacterium terricola]|uniref:DNA-binding response regulator n=1 Tax=Microbacterium terricola TaxID=344163 RepID=A0ABM8E0Y8_9MICO|nr:response regulator transcription factor [Microbacterium terricola]UYK40659.1 response regulator transcription factor [Microbacterium terricola]BDV31608.1 DNA-binding response regulator [Microbacterium terricola]
MKVLVIDDDVGMTTAVARGLTSEGFTVELADNGIDGLWRAREGGHDVIVLDIMLPGMSGYRVCAELRADGDWTPVLMLTAKDGDLDEAEALDTGADDYLVKPFSFPVLVARLHALLRRAALGSPPATSVGDLRMDVRARRAWIGEAQLPLTSREFDVLAFFLHHTGQLLSKSDILAGVWQDDFEGDPNIVEVYIARLRRKIAALTATPVIETVRGAGYRLG